MVRSNNFSSEISPTDNITIVDFSTGKRVNSPDVAADQAENTPQASITSLNSERSERTVFMDLPASDYELETDSLYNDHFDDLTDESLVVLIHKRLSQIRKHARDSGKLPENVIPLNQASEDLDDNSA